MRQSCLWRRCASKWSIFAVSFEGARGEGETACHRQCAGQEWILNHVQVVCMFEVRKNSNSKKRVCPVQLKFLCRDLAKAIGVEAVPSQCRTFTDRRLQTTYLYVPEELVGESVLAALTRENGFVLRHRVMPVVWSYKYAIYRVDSARFPAGEKTSLAAKVSGAAEGRSVRVTFNKDIGNEHWGLVTVMCHDKVSHECRGKWCKCR